jgi:hypothetical protein
MYHVYNSGARYQSYSDGYDSGDYNSRGYDDGRYYGGGYGGGYYDGGYDERRYGFPPLLMEFSSD